MKFKDTVLFPATIGRSSRFACAKAVFLRSFRIIRQNRVLAAGTHLFSSDDFQVVFMARKKKPVSERNGAVADAPFGLRDFRESRKISLEDIAENTKISVRFLQAIEAGDYEKLPGGIFNTSYLRQYAAAIGHNEEALLDDYRRQTSPPEDRAVEQRKGSIFSRWFDLAAHIRS